ncbi:hypothetical protein V1514DRAFT_286427 [Lipomyces japonicus]|uniref:uncharacterized protein n=1 Tax=Lipomyces japonicus TaxID=56871 RepID=UPI0034CE4E78
MSDNSGGEGGQGTRSTLPFRRSYKACLHCRERKVRCDLGSLDNPSDPPCARCKREGRNCEFVPSRRGGAKNVRAGKAKQLSNSFNNNNGSVQGDEDEDDEDDEFGLRYDSLKDKKDSESGSRFINSNGKRQSDRQLVTKSLIKDKGLHTSADALHILAHVADSAEGKVEEESFSNSVHDSAPLSKKLKSRDVYSRWTFRSAKLNQFVPVIQGMITEEEILVLHEFFFERLYPYYPYIPHGLQPVSNLAAHPILLVTILSLASRYCNLPDANKEYANASTNGLSERSKQVHSTIWTYGESLMSQTVWAEASSISLATVLAFLLLSQWNPRAVHYRVGDYANPINLPSNDEDGRGPEGGGGYGGFAAARRSDRMAWMMIGVAVRLSQDVNLFSKWREICIACFYSDITLALRLGRPSMLSYAFQETPLVTFSTLDNSKLDILRIMSFAHQSLYSSPESMYKILNSDNYLPLLKYFRSKLIAWEAKYQLLLRKVGLDRECLLFEFYYTELYIYSLALSPPGHRQVDESFAELYVLYATQAAQQIINVMHRVHKIGWLTRAPIQWFVRSVHAAVFLGKVVALARGWNREQQQDCLSVIKGLSKILRQASPDNLHLAKKYAEALVHLIARLEGELSKKYELQFQHQHQHQHQHQQQQQIVIENATISQRADQNDSDSRTGTPRIPVKEDTGVFESTFTGTTMVDVESMKWFIESYGIGFDSNYSIENEVSWMNPQSFDASLEVPLVQSTDGCGLMQQEAGLNVTYNQASTGSSTDKLRPESLSALSSSPSSPSSPSSSYQQVTQELPTSNNTMNLVHVLTAQTDHGRESKHHVKTVETSYKGVE